MKGVVGGRGRGSSPLRLLYLRESTCVHNRLIDIIISQLPLTPSSLLCDVFSSEITESRRYAHCRDLTSGRKPASGSLGPFSMDTQNEISFHNNLRYHFPGLALSASIQRLRALPQSETYKVILRGVTKVRMGVTRFRVGRTTYNSSRFSTIPIPCTPLTVDPSLPLLFQCV